MSPGIELGTSRTKDCVLTNSVPTLLLIGAALCKVPASLLFQVHYFTFYVLFFSVKYPAAITTVIEADYHQKVVMKFSLKSVSSGDLFTPHQAFVRLTNEKTKQEIFFVAEPEPSKVFKFDLVSESYNSSAIYTLFSASIQQ